MRFFRCVGVLTVFALGIFAGNSSDAQQRLRMAERFASNAPDGSQRVARASYTPRHLRNRGPVGESIFSETYSEQNLISGGCSSCGDSIGAPVDEIIGGDCDCQDECNISSCGPRECWLNGAGGFFYNAEYFIGAQGYRGYNPRRGPNARDDSSFGLHAGINAGLPLEWLTCGFASGQVGIATVQSQLDDRPFGDNREQLFVTSGLFRKVDYGLQGGMVIDFMFENWSVTTELIQMRGELSWAYPNESEFGFRFAFGSRDNPNPNNTFFDTEILNNYRFFIKKSTCYDGFAEIYGGFTVDHGMIGGQIDTPIMERVSVRSTVDYLIPGTGLNDSWNVSVSLVFRPRGRCWHKNYNTPMFNVADNGSMITMR